MGIEVRLSDASRLDDVLPLDIDIVSLGSDACPYKVPETGILRSAHDRVIDAGKSLKVAPPFITTNHYAEMIEFVRALAAWDVPLQVVVNDYGLLYGAKEVWVSSKLRPVAGVALSLSRGRIVRGNEIAEGFVESLMADGRPKEAIDLYKWLVEVTRQNSMHCRIRVDLLKESFHGVGTEAALVEGAIPSLKGIRDLGLEVSAHAGRVVATMSRACPTARFYGESPPACVGRCNEASVLTVRELAPVGVGAVLDEETEKRVLDMMPKFTVRGNVVLHEGLSEPDCVEADSIDNVIFDVRDQSLGELGALCDRWRSSGKVN